MCSGRPKGGLSTLMSKKLKSRVVKIDNWRILPVLLFKNKRKVLVINVYLPVDHQNTNDNHEELIVTVSDIKKVIEESKADDTILIGDFNTDFNRNSNHVRIIKELINGS